MLVFVFCARFCAGLCMNLLCEEAKLVALGASYAFGSVGEDDEGEEEEDK
jgi:hypothetical protein